MFCLLLSVLAVLSFAVVVIGVVVAVVVVLVGPAPAQGGAPRFIDETSFAC